MSTKELQLSDVKRLSDLKRVLEFIASGEARSISQACKLAFDKLVGKASAPATGEPAKDWLAKQAGRFQPIQIVNSQVAIQGGEEPEIVDGEVEELEE